MVHWQLLMLVAWQLLTTVQHLLVASHHVFLTVCQLMTGVCQIRLIMTSSYLLLCSRQLMITTYQHMKVHSSSTVSQPTRELISLHQHVIKLTILSSFTCRQITSNTVVLQP